MKKRISILLLCLLISAFCLFGCAEQKPDVDYDEYVIDSTIEFVIECGETFDEESMDLWNSYPEYIQNYQLMEIGVPVEADAFTEALDSWQAGVEECGPYLGHSDYTYEPSSDGLDVIITAYYEERDAEVKFIFDKNLYLETVTVSAEFSMGEIMSKAGMNTLLGMGVVFFVLILMSFIIYLFKYVPVLQEKITGRKPIELLEAEEQQKKSEEKKKAAAAPVVESTPQAADDTELVAVISAAIAASEGTSTDGFVVRSIRRRPTNKWNS